jgi:hypothetical protein
MAGWGGVQHRLQIGMDRDRQLGPGLLLLHVDHRAVRRVADVLPPHLPPMWWRASFCQKRRRNCPAVSSPSSVFMEVFTGGIGIKIGKRG